MHHGSIQDEALNKALSDALLEEQRRLAKETLGLGATGEFPEGKLVPNDEGEIQFGVTTYEGKVVIEFGKSVHWLGMTPKQAQELAHSLWGHAYEILNEGKSERKTRLDEYKPKRKRKRR